MPGPLPAGHRRFFSLERSGETTARLAFGAVSSYVEPMGNADIKLSPEDVAEARERRLVAMHLQEIEGNPLDAEQVAMFEMFEREAWSHERRRQYLMMRVARRRATSAAE